jgi:hypothetical protein
MTSTDNRPNSISSALADLRDLPPGVFSRERLLCLSRRLTPLFSWSAGVRRPLIPIDQFVVKVHSRCDLACDHCYVYE